MLLDLGLNCTMCMFGLVIENLVAITHTLAFQEKSEGLYWILG